MKRFLPFLLIHGLLGINHLYAESPTTTELLFSPLDPTEFSAALHKAKKEGVSQQTQLEARFLFYIDQEDINGLANLSDELRAFTSDYKIKESNIFSLREDWLSIVEFTSALKAMKNENDEAFKKHITEAFWLSPSQASAYAPYVENYKRNKAMLSVTIPATLKLSDLFDLDKKHTLINQDKNYGILYFWSPWTRGVSEDFEVFIKLSEVAKKRGIPLIAILVDQSEEVRKDAKEFVLEINAKGKAKWAFESKTLEVTTLLRVQQAPTMVIYNKEGSILYNNTPNPSLIENIEDLKKN